MAQTNNLILTITLIFSAALTQVNSAHHIGAPAPAADCSTVILNMADCLSFVTAGSTVMKPEGTCCSGLKSVLKTDAECLCEAFKTSAQLGIQLNTTKAMSLPSACNVKAPSISDCLSFVTAGSTVMKPEGTCCSGLKSVLKTDPECLCEAFKNSAQLGIQLNTTRAMSLPSACNVKAPSISNCGMSLGTATAPVPSPMAMGLAPTMAFGPSTAIAPTPPSSQTNGSYGLAMSTISVFLSVLLSVYFYSH